MDPQHGLIGRADIALVKPWGPKYGLKITDNIIYMMIKEASKAVGLFDTMFL